MRRVSLILIILGVLVLIFNSLYFFVFSFVEFISCLALLGQECYASPQFQPTIMTFFIGLVLIIVGYVNRKEPVKESGSSKHY